MLKALLNLLSPAPAKPKTIPGTIIDVRSKGEFAGGHKNGSINIPLNEIGTHISKIKTMKKPLVLCCASGGRSSQAVGILKNAGIDQVENGGSWHRV